MAEKTPVKKAVKKPKTPAAHPKYSDMVATAVGSLKERGETGGEESDTSATAKKPKAKTPKKAATKKTTEKKPSKKTTKPKTPKKKAIKSPKKAKTDKPKKAKAAKK
ncbi:histone H1-delta-like [Ylistrum balloti]|uniref:histone H1-delta-like n=1 Tax=Ylistrum balloti TaxID=509963 RepID=UPI002905BD72|nr:histone H1-delta-like [Ylistrum balloti]